MARSSTAPVRTRRVRPAPEEPPRRPRPSTPAAEVSSSRAQSRLRTDLISIAIGLLGVLVALALYRPGSCGVVGSFLVHFLRLWMGTVVHVSPLLLIGSAMMLALDYRRATNMQLLVGVAGMMVVLFGWIHLMTTARGTEFDTSGARLLALIGRNHEADMIAVRDGGIFGAAVMSILFPLGKLGSFVTLGAVGVASVLLISELTLRGIFERMHERSRIAAEKARQSAAARKERRREAKALAAEQAAAALPEPPKRQLFLDLGGTALAQVEAPKPEPARRSLFSRRTPENGAAEPAATFEAPETIGEGPQRALAAPSAMR
jgi:cation transport ATPase